MILLRQSNKAILDFEDCLQDKCAINAAADYIITCNTKDFAVAETPVITPIDFLKKINQKE